MLQAMRSILLTLLMTSVVVSTANAKPVFAHHACGGRFMSTSVDRLSDRPEQQPVTQAPTVKSANTPATTNGLWAGTREASPVRMPNERKPVTSPRTTAPSRKATVRKVPAVKPVRR